MNTVSADQFSLAADGSTPDTRSVQQAIDTCAELGGGTVVLPPGRYLCGMLRLRDHVTLHLSNGAVLLASRDPADYPYRAERAENCGPLLVADSARHIAIEGMGVIDGQARDELSRDVPNERRPPFRTHLLLLNRCHRVQIRGVRFQYSDFWALHLKECEDVVIDGITIFNDLFRINTDGIDPDSCRNVRIANCHIVAGDDCIVLKSTCAQPCENIVVTNCTLASGATAIKIGTESLGDFRNVHVANCAISEAMTGLGIFAMDGATCERITFSNISMTDMKAGSLVHRAAPIIFELNRRTPEVDLGHVRDVTLENIMIESDYPSLFQGSSERSLENLTLRNITQRVHASVDFSTRLRTFRRSWAEGMDPPTYSREPAYASFAHVNGLHIQQMTTCIAEVAWRITPRAAIALNHVEQARLRDVRRQPDPKSQTVAAVIESPTARADIR